MRKDDKAEIKSVPGGLTIEHIMPQRWLNNWPLPPDIEDETEAANHRNHIVHTIGNLTLVNHGLNSSLSNAHWSQKRETMLDHSSLFLNKQLVKEAEWDEDAIKSRGHYLANIAKKVWPHGADII